MTEPNLDKILQKLCDYVYNAGASAKHNGIFVGGEPKKEASQAIKALISDQVAKARIDELEFAKPVFNGMCRDARRNQSYYVSKAIALDKRLKELGE